MHTCILAHLQPERMNVLRLEPRWVLIAFPPSATTMAVMMALFPPIENIPASTQHDTRHATRRRARKNIDSLTSILSDNEVDVGRERHLKAAVAHEVLQNQLLDDADVSLALQRVGGTWLRERANH